ncbi:MAG TPA: ABC transporter substrate-binding protein [Candidatus Limnocylindria bacterium]|nr:ABC transporter substrate-binding protein [Candidatus Limnocylindria bacterium]
MATRRVLGMAAASILVLAGCQPAASPTTAPATGTPAAPATGTPAAPATDTPAPATDPPATPEPTPDACAPDNLALKNPGRLTLSTDIPSFPPWWGGDAAEQYPDEPEGGSPWSESAFSAEPYSMEGFEGATAYAIAEAMGFGPEQVDWLANPVFEQAFAPGEKPFDFHMAQVSIRPERAQAVDFSEPYFDSNQSLLALTENDITGATSIEDLKDYLLGAAANTTSFQLIEDVIQPNVEPRVFPDNATALAALAAGGEDAIDGLIIDLGTAFYMRDAELEDFDTPEPEGTIVGQFGPTVQVDQVGAVLELGSPLLDCVNAAIAQIKADGTLDAILDEWIISGQDIPFLE